jgi:selenocysteine lyase/cysteine desulfurase
MPAFTETPADHEKLAAIRAALPATRAGIYLNTGSCGPIPAESAAAMRQAEDRELAIGRASRDAHEDLLERMAETRGALAAVLGTDIAGIALTHSTTDGIGLALGTLDWRPGDRALTTNHEHPGVLGPLAAVSDRHGVDVRIADIGDGGDARGAGARACGGRGAPRRDLARAVDHRGDAPRRGDRAPRPRARRGDRPGRRPGRRRGPAPRR